MPDILIQSIFCFFAVYGIIQMGVNIYNILYNFKLKKDDIYIIITVKNQQETIEGVIRSVVWKSLNNTQSGMVPNILVVDMGSTDETVNILNKLCTEYDFIQVTDSEGYSKILQNLMR